MYFLLFKPSSCSPFTYSCHITFKTMLRCLLITVAALLSLASQSVLADAAYPSNTIRLIVPLAGGGPSDAAARVVARSLATHLKTDIIVDNRPGANGAVGAGVVMTSPADGYTLLFAPLSMAGLPATLKKPPFNSMNDMSVVGTVHGNTMCVFAHPSLGIHSIKSLLDYAKSNPGKLAYGVSSLSEYLVIAQLVKATGIDLVRVPYKGSAQMMPDFLEGRIQIAAMPVRAGAAHTQAGKLKALGCASATRLDALIDTPTMTESGLGGIPTATGHVIVAPPKTPADIVARLSEELKRAFQDGSLRRELQQLQLYGDLYNISQSQALISDTEKIWHQFVREAAIELE